MSDSLRKTTEVDLSEWECLSSVAGEYKDDAGRFRTLTESVHPCGNESLIAEEDSSTKIMPN